ncbi:hypothetical protein L7F22_031266 [Adiantum nelumboides]|nr:hypothetical protein [Adiantum nelumboides]MCO5577434.1 hypothetical protein [Adiantum nelumboides]
MSNGNMLSAGPQLVKVRASDGVEFILEKWVVSQFEAIELCSSSNVVQSTMSNNIIRSTGEDVVIYGELPLHNVSSKVLEIVVDYCRLDGGVRLSASDAGRSVLLQKHWLLRQLADEKLQGEGDVCGFLGHLMQAASYLHVPRLLAVACHTVAELMKGRSPEQVRHIFRITNDLTADEEEDIKRNTLSAFNDTTAHNPF